MSVDEKLIAFANRLADASGAVIHDATVTLTNEGTIANTATAAGSAGVSLQGSGGNTLVNSGTIIGNSGTAVQFGAGNDLLVLQSGASFQGVVDGGLGVNTVQFGTSGTIANLGLGTKYLNFTNIGAGAGATLTNTGSFIGQVQLNGAGAGP